MSLMLIVSSIRNTAALYHEERLPSLGMANLPGGHQRP
jgi:hypothetical protein